MDERYARQGKRNRGFEKRGKRKYLFNKKKERDWKRAKTAGPTE